MNIKEFFYFQKSDRHVLMVLLGIAIVFMSLVYFLGSDEMEENVLRYEPETALFVPNDDPLLFYRHIMNYAISSLKQGGRLYFEINPLYADSIVESLLGLGFIEATKIDDQYGKARFVKATKG